MHDKLEAKYKYLLRRHAKLQRTLKARFEDVFALGYIVCGKDHGVLLSDVKYSDLNPEYVNRIKDEFAKHIIDK